jgi:hypothetical protein
LLTKSSQDKLLDQQAAQYLYTAQDYQKINELAPPSKSSYIWYYSPVASDGDDFVVNNDWRYDEAPTESRVHPQRALLLQRIPKKKRGAKYLSPYLAPPSPKSVSSYAKYQSHAMNLEDEQRINYLPRNHRPDFAIIKDKRKKKIQDQGPVYIRDHAPLQQTESESEVYERKTLCSLSQLHFYKIFPIFSLRLNVLCTSIACIMHTMFLLESVAII